MPERFSFRAEAVAPDSQARAGVLSTPHGDVPTPLFMPVGTRGSVKGILPEQLRDVGARVLLANTYFLMDEREQAIATLDAALERLGDDAASIVASVLLRHRERELALEVVSAVEDDERRRLADEANGLKLTVARWYDGRRAALSRRSRAG